MITNYLNDELAKGFAVQNQLYASAMEKLKGTPEATADMERLKIPIHQADLSAILASFMQAIRGIKKEVGTDVAASQKLRADSAEKIYAELAKGQDEPNRIITVEEV